jgi:phosphoribosylaminoimidazole-succinocarboxamide synthase
MKTALLETNLEGLPKRSGKVRDLYDLGDRLLLIATDRISAFDWVLPNGIPDKGRVLTSLSKFWFETVVPPYPHHLLSTDLESASLDLAPDVRADLTGRVMIARKAEVVPFECVVRGHLAGSGWKEYRMSGTVCGEPLPPGLVEGDRIKDPIFTPATKATSGHDENISFARMAETIGKELAVLLRDMSLALYEEAYQIAHERGLILADTKFEWGLDANGNPLLVDEALTPDSSRYWSLKTYKPGGPQPSFDKQFVRDWLETTGWDKASPPPILPDAVVEKTRQKYIEAFEILTGQPFPWK